MGEWRSERWSILCVPRFTSQAGAISSEADAVAGSLTSVSESQPAKSTSCVVRWTR